ncbi:hypothetical protein COV19_06570 [Candidatus Woesearchaeota archaeon CG10_big_fil_rev_8_21_14_0_10_44_13]|nr:MAG: hypothetical protein COV19_06570 [Candidatus Woesearchaeota archaeon CG10_big_fil_rev_8_21_14_0_10_44_13]
MAWKKEEVEYLKNNFADSSDTDLSKNLNKSPNSIRIKASRLNLKKYSSINRGNLELNKEEEQIIIGGLLGDLHCRKTKTSINARLEGGHGAEQKGYLIYKMELLRNLNWIIWKSKNGTYHYQSKSYACLNYYHNLFYPNNKKIVNQEILNKVERLGLLIWFMDDGCYRKRDKNSSIYTNCFSYYEQTLMKDWFDKKWGLSPKIYTAKDPKNTDGNVRYYLAFSVKDTIKLRDLVKDFEIPDCMSYKFRFADYIYQNPTPGILAIHN